MQSEGRYFIAKYKDKDWNFQLENKYIKYLVASIREIITNLIVPISRVPEEIYSIVEKYRNNEDLYGPQFDESSDDENDMNDMNDENDEV
jgi:hypothetical protein